MSEPADQLAERLVAAAVGMTDLMAICLGDRLGYYRHLSHVGPCSAAELAQATATTERYVQEWLEQQAVSGLLEVDTLEPPASARRFSLSPGAHEVLVDPDNLAFLAPLARQMVSATAQTAAIGEAFRTGGGVPWSAYGAHMRESEGDLNRPAYLTLLADEWLAALPDVQDRLRSAPRARVADIGCGAGWSSIGLALGYPDVRVDAFDLDPESVELARHNVAEAGLADRVIVHCTDVGETTQSGGYALVTAFECLHDLPHPVEALRAMRGMTDPGAPVLVADMKVADRFTAPGDLVERLMYGFSLAVCLPDSMSTPGSAATGTVIREETVRHYATAAGFTSMTVLPVEHDLWRFYRME